MKTGKALQIAQDQGLGLTWDSRVDKFDKRLAMIRQGWRGDWRRDERRGENARSAPLSKESIVRHVSMYEFFSKHFFKRCKLMNHERLVALQVLPAFSADCAAIDHDLHQAFARRNVLAFWRLMPTVERCMMAKSGVGGAVDKRFCGSTLLKAANACRR